MVGYLYTRHQTWDLPAPPPGLQTWDLIPPPLDIRHGTYPPPTVIWHLVADARDRYSLQAGSRHPSGIISCFYIFSPKKLQSKLKNEHRQNSICKRLHGTGDTVLSEIKTHFCFVFDKRKSKHRLFGNEWCSVASLRITQHAFSIGYVLHHSDTQRSNI